MALTPLRRPSRLLAAGALAAVALTGCGGGETDAAPATPAPTASASTVPGPTAEETPEEFCEVFLDFVDASAQFTGAQDTATGETLVDTARTLYEMPTPIAMTAGARAALDQLVTGSLIGVAAVPDVEVDTAPDPANDAEPDPTEMDAYLQDVCPA